MPLFNSLNFGEVFLVLFWKEKKHLSVKYSYGKSKVNEFESNCIKTSSRIYFLSRNGKVRLQARVFSIYITK